MTSKTKNIIPKFNFTLITYLINNYKRGCDQILQKNMLKDAYVTTFQIVPFEANKHSFVTIYQNKLELRLLENVVFYLNTF